MSDRRGEPELLAALLASPDDDAARAVYADLLAQRGELRGELIACQLAARRGDERAARRAAELLASHADAWAAELGELVPGSARFDRGFPVGCAVHAASLARLRPGPAWATVAHLALRGASWALAADVAQALDALAPHAGLEALSVELAEDPDDEAQVAPWLQLLSRPGGRLASLELRCPAGTLALGRRDRQLSGAVTPAPAAPGSWSDLSEDPLELALQAHLAPAIEPE